MLTGFRWLGLETWFLEDALPFYRDVLDCPITRHDTGMATVSVGRHNLRLQEPGPVPRGGVHVHYALATSPQQYEAWVSTFEAYGTTWTHSFGDSSSVYVYDPDHHCVEIGDIATGPTDLEGVFEVALEVEALDRATEFYTMLGFETVDTGTDRRRVRLDGPIALELWEPQRGIAEARGGVHTHLGFEANDPTAVADTIAEEACAIETKSSGVEIRDPDGHYLTITQPGTSTD